MVLILAILASAWADDPAPTTAPTDPPPVEEPAPQPPTEPAPTEEPVPEGTAEEPLTEVPPPKLHGWHKTGWGVGPLPAVNYNTDEGFGFGAIVDLWRYDGKTAPYKSQFELQFFMTTKAIHSHIFEVDLLDVGDLPLRIQGRVQLDATKTANFCGYGWDVTCDVAVAEDQADELGLTGEEREDYIRHYYRVRWVRPLGFVTARYRVFDGPPKVEVFGGWRGEMFIPGDFSEKAPYPGSLYEQTVGVEEGFISVFQAGADIDTRDNEAAPRRGYFHEVSIRGTLPPTDAGGYFGFNTTLRFFAPLAPNGRLTLASRTVFDGMVGDAEVREMAAVGGLKNYSFGGGDQAGRGIRLRRYIGRVKAMEQLELRWAFLRVGKKAPVEFTLLGFCDILVAAEHWSDIGPAFAHPHPGEGIGLRIALTENFILRGDVGVSHAESWFKSPGVYLDVKHIF